MKRIVAILSSLLLTAAVADGQVLNNADPKAIAAIKTGYAATLAEEKNYTDLLKDVLAHYGKAEAAAVEIYRSRYQDRKGLSQLGMWGLAEENYYYQRIYNIVTRAIMPMTVKVAKQCLKEPAKALYWGSLLYETCNETKELCMQFETVVCNSRLTFKSIDFLKINPELTPIISVIANDNLMDEIRQTVSLFGDVTTADLSSDIATLKSKMETAISSSGNLMADKLTSATDLSAGVTANVTAVIGLINHFDVLAAQAGNGDISGLLSSLVPEEALTDLFRVSDYDVTTWLGENYLNRITGQEYTQRYTICRKLTSSKVLLDYVPPLYTDYKDYWYSYEWYNYMGFGTNRNEEHWASPDALLPALSISNSVSGYDRLTLPREDDPSHNIKVTRTLKRVIASTKIDYWSTQLEYTHFYAYAIKVEDETYSTEPVYDVLFDSYSQNAEYVEQKLQNRIASLKADDAAAGLNYDYVIVKSEPKYYQPATTERMQDISLATVSVTCEEDYALESGNYKTDPTIRNYFHLKYTSAQLKSFFRTDLLHCVRGETTQYYTPYGWDSAVPDDVNDVFDNMLDYIFAKMAVIARNYKLTWVSEGYWEDNTYYRRGNLPEGEGYLTFKAPFTFHGDWTDELFGSGYIYYEAVSYSVKWELTEHLIETHAYDVLDLRDMDDKAKVDRVNGTMAEARQKYPDCEVNVDYARYEWQDDDSEDVIHLLWSSDRLAVARNIEARLVKIYTKLMNMNRFMQYRITLADMSRKAAGVGITPERMKSAAQSALERWSNVSDTTTITSH